MYPSAPSGLREWWSRHGGGHVPVPPCVPLLQPPAPVALQVGAEVGPPAAGGGRSGSDSGIKPVRKLIWIKVKHEL